MAARDTSEPSRRAHDVPFALRSSAARVPRRESGEAARRTQPYCASVAALTTDASFYAGVVDHGGLDRLVTASDWRGLADALAALSEPEALAAGVWYRKSGRATARRITEQHWDQSPRVVQLLLALNLAGTPEEASKNCQWGRRFIWRDDEIAAARCGDALVARGRDWAAEFVRLASSAVFRGESQRGVGEVVSLTSAAVAAYELEMPATETYAVGWTSLLSWAHVYRNAQNRTGWCPLVLLTFSAGSARPAYELGDQLTLADCLAATPAVTDLLTSALATPNAFHEWASFSEDGWTVESTIREAVRRGVVDRDPLIDHALRALSRDDRANNQRVIAALLKGLDPTPHEMGERTALLMHVLPTVHGSATKVLLDLALSAELSDDEMLDLGTVILSRPEKAQKATLLKHLTTTIGSARDALLALAADSEDEAFASKARKLLGTTDGTNATEPDRSTASSVAGLAAWSHATSPFHAGLLQLYTADEAGLDRARSDEQTWSRITSEATFLDLTVRFAHRDLPRLRAAVAAWPPPDWYSNVRTPFLVHQWVTTGDPHRTYQRVSTQYRYDPSGGEPVVQHHTSTIVPAAHLVFTDRLVEETLRRLGTLTELLSTPSHSDGTLAAAELADRVRRAKSVGYGPYDLAQALLRLGPTTPADSKLFDRLSLPPADGDTGGRSWRPKLRHTPSERDGAAVIRAWIAAGGWSARSVDVPSVEPRTSQLQLPLPDWLLGLDGLAGVCEPTSADTQRKVWHSTEPGPWLGVCPWDVENLAAMIALRADQDSAFHAQNLPLLVTAAGPIGGATHHHVARLLTHPRLDSRLLAARHAATLATQGRLQPGLLKERSLALFRHGDLSLARAAHGWSELAALSSLSVVWPTWLATLDEAAGASKKPAGLADLLRATREHVPVLLQAGHTDWAPASLRTLADERGSSKAVVEARALLASLEGGGQR